MTPRPSWAMAPTFSWPKMTGCSAAGSCQVCTSDPHTAAISILTSTAPGSTSGTANSRTSRGLPGPTNTAALHVSISASKPLDSCYLKCGITFSANMRMELFTVSLSRAPRAK